MTIRPLPTTFMLSVVVAIAARPVEIRALQPDHPLFSPQLKEQADTAVARGISFLLSTQESDGGWEIQGHSNLGITAVVVKALAKAPGVGPRHESVQRGLEFIRRFVRDDGGIYNESEGMLNYHTSVALMALAATDDPDNARLITNAQQFLTRLQWDEGEEYPRTSPWYGGAGYGHGKRPDLSNTQMMIEALHESGLPTTDPAYQKALVFISRCQMSGSTNDQEFAAKMEGEAAGFIYTPVNGGESKAGTESVDGVRRLRSYGSMSYAAFKSMLFANVDRNDPRVQRAMTWIRQHYTLDENPNMPGQSSKEGLYYYYMVFSKALAAWGEDAIMDGRGVWRLWREDLVRKLVELQRSDGSWVNEADRWYEGNPYLVTAYALLAIENATLSNPSRPQQTK